MTSTMSVAVPFPNPRDFYSATTNADLIQPGLGPLQPNLDDMDLDLDWLNSVNNGPSQQQQQVPSCGGNGRNENLGNNLTGMVTIVEQASSTRCMSSNACSQLDPMTFERLTWFILKGHFEDNIWRLPAS